jgi:RNA polymerase sigma-70 factor (ECF subfamily)
MDSTELEKLRPKLRFRIAHDLGFACPDIEDIVQETLHRYLVAVKGDQIRTPDAAGAFVNGICRNVIAEYRRRMFRDLPMPEVPPERPSKSLSPSDLFILQDAITQAMQQLLPRDRQILQLFYLEERTLPEILEAARLTEANFRVVLCRAKERFRKIYQDACNEAPPTFTHGRTGA